MNSTNNYDSNNLCVVFDPAWLNVTQPALAKAEHE